MHTVRYAIINLLCFVFYYNNWLQLTLFRINDNNLDISLCNNCKAYNKCNVLMVKIRQKLYDPFGINRKKKINEKLYSL